MRSWLALAALFFVTIFGFGQETRTLVEDAFAPYFAKRKAGGMIVGISGADGRREFFGFGKTQADGSTPTESTIFEIGSISKPITALLLAILAEAGELKLDDPVAPWLPKDWEMPKRGDREITFRELATHTSGLPRMPGNFGLALGSAKLAGKDSESDPYSHYSEKQLAAGLAATKVKDVASPASSYSNFGYGLLGEAMSRNLGRSYENLIRDRISGPLAMKSTCINVPEQKKEKMAVGHNLKGEAVADWNFETLGAAGAIRSTAEDMLNFLEAENGRKPAAFDSAIKLTQKKHADVSSTMDIGLGWYIRKHDGTTYWWHNGATGGFASFAAFSREPALAIVVLTNVGRDSADRENVDAVGDRLFREMIDRAKKPSVK